MKLSFHGAARTVTGSKHIIQLNNGKKLLLDCGMFQGLGRETLHLNEDWGFDPKEITYMVLSHAHIDHVGLLPKLVKDGYTGPVFCTSATADLARILMNDSAGIQEGDVRHINAERRKQGREEVDPLYTEDDAADVMKLMHRVEYGTVQAIDEDIDLLFTDAGHLLGSAAVNLTIREDGNTKRITFSGDIGRYHDAILRAPEPFPQADIVIMESTYGNKLHGLSAPVVDDLLGYIKHTCLEKGGKLIIPSFSVGRTQELLYMLNRLELERRLPAIKYYVDSPLSIEATEVIKRHPECFNEQVEQTLRRDDDVFKFEGLEYTQTPEESIRLDIVSEPCVIISSSGMAEAGRVKHHIAQGVSDSNNTILIVGYCTPGSLGGQLRDGKKQVFIYGQQVEVEAEVGVINALSGHGDYDDLLHWLSCQSKEELKTIFLVHGEYEVQQAFRDRILRKEYKEVIIPDMHETVDIG